MNFEPTADQAMIAETFARFLDEHSSMARVRAALPGGFDPELWRSFAEMGGFGIRAPEAAGGLGLGLFDAVLVMDEVGRTLASGPIAEAIVAAGLLGRYGEVICSLGYSEPGSGSDVFAAQCKATPEGNGWRIDGTKMFTRGANLSTYVLMLCRTNTEVAKHKGLTMFIVPLKADGVTIQPVYTFQDERTNITF